MDTFKRIRLGLPHMEFVMFHGSEPAQSETLVPPADLATASHSPALSPQANAEIVHALRRYEAMLRNGAALIARQKKADIVSAIDVQIAEQTIQFAPQRGLSRHMGTFGGVAIAPALSIIVLLSQGTQLSTGSVVLGIASAILGIVAIAIHVTRH